MIHDTDLQEIRQKLEAELVRLQGYIKNSNEGKGQRAGTNLDRDDLAHNFASRERRLALRDVENAQVAQIEDALERIEDGTYGMCAGCGEAIAPKRLEIIPYATLCVRCQRKQVQY